METHFSSSRGRDKVAGVQQPWVVDCALVGVCLVIPNLLLALHFKTGMTQSPNVPIALPTHEYVLWALLNCAVLALLFVMRQWLVRPLGRICQHLRQVRITYSEAGDESAFSILNVWHIASDVGRFAGFALEYYRRYQEVSIALEQSRHVITRFAMEQEAILNSTNREIATQYRSVLSYANYLEEQIVSNKLDPSLRYDLDDICESSFNLKLIAGSLSMLGMPLTMELGNVPLAPLMQQTILALAPALDRRSMKLTSAEVDMSVAAHGDPGTLAQILWMMLLGMVRYAADESTLRLRCLHNREGTHAILSIVISELSPNRMSENERADHLARQLEHLTPHMFAETIRIHGNVQLADLLIQRLGGNISVLPLTVSACEISMVLPAATRFS
jgi:hypothetical protein